MPDISMCTNTFCKQKENCYRWRAKPKRYQGYSEFKPKNNDVGEAFECDNWISHRDANGELRIDLRY